MGTLYVIYDFKDVRMTRLDDETLRGRAEMNPHDPI